MDDANLQFYLSEMAVSDRHGGGLTLQRVLGEDLDAIQRFVHVSRFAQNFPPTKRVRSRCVDLPMWLEDPAVQKYVGSRPAAWLASRRWLQGQHAALIAAHIQRMCVGFSKFTGLVCPQGIPSLLALEKLKRHGKVRYITWMMDDHIVRFRNGGWQYLPGVHDLMQRHLSEASTVFVISSVLGDFYQRDFGVRSEVLFGPADWEGDAVRVAPSATGPAKIAYFGSVNAWQLDALVRFAITLPPAQVRLHIYTHAEVLPPALRLPAVEMRGAIPKETVLNKMRAYDGVLLPMSFEQSERHLSEFNIATKMSECLASGTIPIVYGPTYAAMVRFLQPTGAACIVTDDLLKDWPFVVNNLKNVAYRSEVLGAAHELVQMELSTSVMRSRWRTAVNKLEESEHGGVNQERMN